MCAYLLFESWKYVSAAWKIREFSGDAGGLPFPAIPLLKTVLLLMPLTVALQGLSLALASLRNIRSGS
jgi:TRAP-type mannitol/chloroaromatic compound transport system permease small subunit